MFISSEKKEETVDMKSYIKKKLRVLADFGIKASMIPEELMKAKNPRQADNISDELIGKWLMLQ